jgi:hypothetical protein
LITLKQFFMGRDATYASELTDEIRANAALTVERVNKLLAIAATDGVFPAVKDDSEVASGWRPFSVNDKTANAAKGTSNHITGKACDVRDTKARDLARWCLRNLHVLADLGLYMENPMWTPTWVHVQTVPPHSEKRVYVPSENPPLAAALPEQEQRAFA